MPVTNAPNGIGGTVADALITAKPLVYSGEIWYVDSQTGDAAFSGKDRKFPLATIQQAVTALGTGQNNIIVCLDGHTEDISAAITIDKRMTISGDGQNSNVPTVELSNGFTANMFTVTSTHVKFRNLRFRMQTGGTSAFAYVESAQDALTFLGCHFDMNERTLGSGVSQLTGADNWRYDNCKFEQFDTTSPPVARSRPAILVGGAITGLTMTNCVFDGGVNGFQNAGGEPYAFDSSAGVITDMDVLDMSLLRGSDFAVATTTTGHIGPAITTGSSRIIWP